MAGTAAEPMVEGKDSQPVRPGRGTRKTRAWQGDGGEGLRFFLAKHGAADGLPNLDKEFGSESEAIVESLKSGLNYYAVSEWRGVADFSGKKPQLRREPVTRSRKTA